MKRFAMLALCLAFLAGYVGAAGAFGPHDDGCMDCHSTHYAEGEYIMGIKPLYKTLNPARTRVQADVVTLDALCLGCHNEEEGILPVNMHKTHPTGVKPRYAPVPAKYLRGGVLTCVGCHDPHPSNPNYKYLIVPTKDGKDMGLFCGQCHPGQSDKTVLGSAKALKMTMDAPIEPIIPFKAPAAQPVIPGVKKTQ